MSSNSTHRHSSAESKGIRFGRSFLAFALSLTVSLLSLFCCIRFYFVTPQSLVNIFANEQYVTALRNDVVDYAHDVCRGSMLPEDTLDETVSYSALYDIVEAYFAGSLGASQEFTKSTYEDLAKELKGNMADAINARIEKEGLKTDSKQKKGAQKLSEYVRTYILERIEVAHIDMLETVVNIGKIAGLVGIIVSALLSVVLVLIIISIGEKRYRSLRYIVYSMFAGAMINLTLIGGVEIVKTVKSLVLYPAYIADAFMSYVGRCEAVVLIAAISMFFAGFILTAAVWKMSRDSKK